MEKTLPCMCCWPRVLRLLSLSIKVILDLVLSLGKVLGGFFVALVTSFSQESSPGHVALAAGSTYFCSLQVSLSNPASFHLGGCGEQL